MTNREPCIKCSIETEKECYQQLDDEYVICDDCVIHLFKKLNRERAWKDFESLTDKELKES